MQQEAAFFTAATRFLADGVHRTRNRPVNHHYLGAVIQHDSRIRLGGSHGQLSHEFVTAILEDRDPLADVYEALAMTVPGIVAHQSALKDGEQTGVPRFERPSCTLARIIHGTAENQRMQRGNREI